MRMIRVRKCKNNDGYRYRFTEKGTSVDLTQDEISRMRVLNLVTTAPSIKSKDRKILAEKFSNKTVNFL